MGFRHVWQMFLHISSILEECCIEGLRRPFCWLFWLSLLRIFLVWRTLGLFVFLHLNGFLAEECGERMVEAPDRGLFPGAFPDAREELEVSKGC